MRRQLDSPPGVELSFVALILVNPMNPVIVVLGWTEAISFPFLVAAAVFWTKRPVLSAVTLGLALSTKQYFLVVVPLLFFLPGPGRLRRVSTAVGTAALTFVPFLIWDARGLFRGVVTHHLSRRPRPDSASLAGLEIHVPTAVGVGLALLVGILVVRRSKGGGWALLAISTALAVFAMLSVRSFRNSWWLIAVADSAAIIFGSDLKGNEPQPHPNLASSRDSNASGSP